MTKDCSRVPIFPGGTDILVRACCPVPFPIVPGQHLHLHPPQTHTTGNGPITPALPNQKSHESEFRRSRRSKMGMSERKIAFDDTPLNGIPPQYPTSRHRPSPHAPTPTHQAVSPSDSALQPPSLPDTPAPSDYRPCAFPTPQQRRTSPPRPTPRRWQRFA